MANHCKEKIKSNFGIHETNDDIIGGGEKYSASVVYQIQFLNVKFDRLAYEYVKLNVNINPRMLTERNKTDSKKTRQKREYPIKTVQSEIQRVGRK